MILSAVHEPLTLLDQVVVAVVLLAFTYAFFRWFWGRWDRLTRHRYVRWHRSQWRENTDGHDAVYRDTICRCCR